MNYVDPSGYVMVGLRATANAMGLQVDWKNGKAIVSGGDKRIIFKPGDHYGSYIDNNGRMIVDLTALKAARKPIIIPYHKVGMGLQAKVKLLGAGGELGIGRYYEDINTPDAKDCIEGGVKVQLTNKVALAIQGSKSINTRTGEVTGDGLAGLQVGKHVIGVGGNKELDMFGESEIGALTPFGGGIIGAKINYSEIYRRARYFLGY